MSTATLPDLLTRPQAAEFLGVRVQTLAAWACSGRYSLPMVKVGRCVKYRLSDLEKFLADRTVTSTGELDD
ncbi:MAG TPA: helix-turn-helix domain-containing protein [Thermoguttaceae bacterium]|nr:helix-turn-helix domain-containing protein [Thermoguttaceae bacterium]